MLENVFKMAAILYLCKLGMNKCSNDINTIIIELLDPRNIGEDTRINSIPTQIPRMAEI